ncbi:MAG: hypothetical protein ACLTDR_15335 [Adlercreutzia equolifaciens]
MSAERRFRRAAADAVSAGKAHKQTVDGDLWAARTWPTKPFGHRSAEPRRRRPRSASPSWQRLTVAYLDARTTRRMLAQRASEFASDAHAGQCRK